MTREDIRKRQRRNARCEAVVSQIPELVAHLRNWGTTAAYDAAELLEWFAERDHDFDRGFDEGYRRGRDDVA